MGILFDREKLTQLLGSLYTMTGIRAEIRDGELEPVCASEKNAPFCTLIQASPQGLAKCMDCCRQMAAREESGTGSVLQRCHAGVREGLVPIRREQQTLAFIRFGQFLDDSDPEQQWQKAREGLSWYPGNMEALRAAFGELRRLSPEEQQAYAGLAGTLAEYLSLKDIIQASEQTDLQRLEAYLDGHYTERLSLDEIAGALGMGRTRLCALARQHSGEGTVTRMIARRRIEAAKKKLLHSDLPVSAVAGAVGVSDYNYFTKIFRSATGKTPSAFRREGRKADPERN